MFLRKARQVNCHNSNDLSFSNSENVALGVSVCRGDVTSRCSMLQLLWLILLVITQLINANTNVERVSISFFSRLPCRFHHQQMASLKLFWYLMGAKLKEELLFSHSGKLVVKKFSWWSRSPVFSRGSNFIVAHTSILVPLLIER